jgi:hypothetical protein
MADDKTKTVALGGLAALVVGGTIAIGAAMSDPAPTPEQLEADRITSADRLDPLVEVDRLNSVGAHVPTKVRRSTIPVEVDRLTSVSPSTKDAP